MSKFLSKAEKHPHEVQQVRQLAHKKVVLPLTNQNTTRETNRIHFELGYLFL